jgi:chaperone required for assembly of F1-ATPase
MSESQNWYVVKENSKTCQILTASELDTTSQAEKWGPYETEGEAIAKRVGLIRARKCQPM